MNNINVKIEKINSPFMCYCQKVIPLAFDESLSYYEQLCNLTYYIKTIITTAINRQTEAIAELQNAYITLQKYVDTYFDNLDVQKEINNKLDQMAESGQLADLIAQYLQIQSLLTFNNINDMQKSTNLVNGSFAKTYGYYEYNDGGGNLYKVREITNTDVIDNMTLFALADNRLVAELVNNGDYINIKCLGAIDGKDITNIFNKAIEIGNKKGFKIYIPKGQYYINNKITITEKNNIIIYGNSDTVLDSTNCENEMLSFERCNNIKVNNLKMIGKNAGSIIFNDCSNVKISDCDVTLNYKEGINASALNIQRVSGSELDDCENFTIENCKITTSFLGILFQGKSNKYLKNINVNNCEFIGKDLNISGAGELLKIDYYTENTIITNNIFKGAKSSCITCEEKSDKIIISNNVLNGNNDSVYGIRTYYGQSQATSNYLDINNNLIDNFDTGIVNEHYDNVEISNNTIINCRTNSLSLWNSNVKMVANNIIKGAGCLLRASADFINNYIETTNDYCLQMINTSNCNIINNTFKNGYLNCRATENLLIKNNCFINSSSDTLGVITVFANDSTQRNNVTIVDNIIKATNSAYGIYIANVYNNVLLQNNSVSNTTNKLYLASSLLNVRNLDFRKYVSSSNTVPTGASSVGDLVYNSNPTAGGYIGWVYTSNGWKGYGLISS